MFDLPPVEQVECLTHAIYHEARSESFKGQLMVGYVIKARRNDDRWPDRYCDVIEQPWQFSFVREIGYSHMSEVDAKHEAEEVAKLVIRSDSPFSVCMFYYHADHVYPAWDWSKLNKYDHVGNHIFYTDVGC